ncbi:hypothetical protein CEXT_321711 [Caerostris extrusa]|uniref:Uncharacterized protein n=1 Tax=Caerostris extrusa TaxID=172846 RepID=A0AAV4U960_CAEEX|nr:hypothetical protein CEXT_321711 [Caerostris extrusa]
MESCYHCRSTWNHGITVDQHGIMVSLGKKKSQFCFYWRKPMGKTTGRGVLLVQEEECSDPDFSGLLEKWGSDGAYYAQANRGLGCVCVQTV